MKIPQFSYLFLQMDFQFVSSFHCYKQCYIEHPCQCLPVPVSVSLGQWFLKIWFQTSISRSPGNFVRNADSRAFSKPLN